MAGITSIRGFTFCCSVLVLAVCIQSAMANDEYDDVKVKRGGTVGLYPFPRVGRSDPELANWEPATAALLNSLEDYNELYRAAEKRQGLMPFPRVGRSGYKPIWIAAAPPSQHGNSGRMQKRSANFFGLH